MKNNKKGISLIVLVITIIVMVVLAAAVVISISNSNIIDRADQAVTDTNIKEVQQHANLVWAEEYIDGKRGTELKNAVLAKLENYVDKYFIDVTDKGVIVGQPKAPLKAVDYYTYEYDDATMTATLSGVKEKYAKKAYYTDYNTYEYTSAIIGDDGSIVTEILIPSTTIGADGKEYTVTGIKAGVFTAETGIGNTSGATEMPRYTRIELPNTIKTIENNAFYGCNSLKVLRIPSNVEVTGYGCLIGSSTDLEELYFGGEIEEWMAMINNSYDITYAMSNTKLYFNDKLVTSVVIPEGVTEIPYNLFSGCASITSVIIPNTVTTINGSAFYSCTNLSSITIPNGVKSIDWNAFSYCEKLSSVIIPVSVTNIYNYAFNGCTNLTDVYYTGTETEWNAITIRDGNNLLTNATIHYNHVISE